MNHEIHFPATRRAFYDREPEAVPLARNFVRHTLIGWGLADRRRCRDVLLCVSELTTNAVQHAVPGGHAFRLGLRLEEDWLLRVDVRDTSPERPRLQEQEDSAERGRGLLIVESLADKWGVDEHILGKTVWCELRISRRIEDEPLIRCR